MLRSEGSSKPGRGLRWQQMPIVRPWLPIWRPQVALGPPLWPIRQNSWNLRIKNILVILMNPGLNPMITIKLLLLIQYTDPSIK